MRAITTISPSAMYSRTVPRETPEAVLRMPSTRSARTSRLTYLARKFLVLRRARPVADNLAPADFSKIHFPPAIKGCQGIRCMSLAKPGAQMFPSRALGCRHWLARLESHSRYSNWHVRGFSVPPKDLSDRSGSSTGGNTICHPPISPALLVRRRTPRTADIVFNAALSSTQYTALHVETRIPTV